MSPLDHQLHRLFAAAAQAPRDTPTMPLGFATRVLALAAPGSNSETVAAIFRYALGIGCALMLMSVAVGYRLQATPVGVEVAIANSAIGVNLP